MSFTINTNISSLQAQQYLNVNGALQAKTISRVTSGLRIIASGDDAAGLAVANGYRSDQAVLGQGIRNANDGLSQLQIIDGGINNISQLLDRARTLATQSASGTFTGDRTVLNSEFQSVVSEINRQSQAIGLDQNGAFAANLQVFIGGGKTNNGISQISNGSVSVDLSKSTVDARSLGLTGVQAIGVSGTDIGAGSVATSLSSILGNTTNTSSAAAAGFSTFILKGPGFDGSGVKISFNTANLGGTSDLVTAVNAAIQAAANSGTQAATALKNANITATVNTDSSGKQQLAFSSSTSAFQIQAGDRVSNALLGNFEQNAVATGTDTAAFTDTSLGGAAKQLTVAIDGGSAFTVNVTQGVSTSKGQIVADLNANSTFALAATASLTGNQIVIKSKGNTSSSAVTFTTTTLSTALGLSSATAASASTGASLTTTLQGAGPVAAGANVIASNAAATAAVLTGANTLILTAGSSGAQTLTLANLGGTETKAEIAADINTQITANGNFTAANAAQLTASVVNNQIVLTASSPASSITVGNGTLNAALGFTNGTVATQHVATTSDTIRLRFQGSSLTSPLELTLSATTAGTTTSATVLADLQSRVAGNSQLQAAGITLSTGTVGDSLVFTSAKGEQFQVQATGDSQNLLGLGSFQTGTGNNLIDYTSLTAGSAYSTGIAGGSGTANLEFSLNGLKSSSNAVAVSLSGAGTDATSASQTTTVAAAANGQINLNAGAATGSLKLLIDGTIAVTVALGNSATTQITAAAAAINTALGANGSAVVDANNHVVIKSATTGANSSVEVLATSDAPTLADFGLTSGTTTRGANATEANVLNQINTAIASNTALANAGLQAKDSGGSIQIVSNNTTYFRVNTFGGGNIGFGNLGSTFTGTAQSAAPAVSQYFDAQGASATSTLAYSDTLYGADKQTVAVTGIDSAGAKHSLGITIENDTTARQQTIDQALSQINTKLQQSNDSTLQRIVAVKDSSGGAQSIRFLSTLSSFQVGVDTDPGGTGITAPTGAVATSGTLGTGLTSSVDSLSNASAAVGALSTAVALLGKAQAVVGRGQNQFNYAVNLAQSQLTNLAAAESRIRDADLASEAANLTKSQILVQAGVAALAQANSAPQQILSLLRA